MTPGRLPDRPRLKEKCRVVWDEHRERHLLLYPEGVVLLNETGRRILELADGERRVDGIVRELESEYEDGVDAIGGDVRRFLGRVADQGLLTGAAGDESRDAGGQ